jgi:hypothetical protein
MPIILHVCPTCNGGIKQSRGWQWIDPRPWLKDKGGCREDNWQCPAYKVDGMGEKVGLIWIGTQFYKTPQAFAEEANRMGVSRRIQAVPKGLELGKHYVWFAHPHVQEVEVEVMDAETGEPKIEKQWQGGVFRIVKPTRIEKIITQTQSEDDDEMEALEKRGITPVVVPDNDPDHQGSVYDDDTETMQGEFRV